MNAIRRAVKAVGGQKALALAIDVSPQQLNQWVKGKRPVPANQCIPIEEATGGAVDRYELRPDVFGNPPSAKHSKAA